MIPWAMMHPPQTPAVGAFTRFPPRGATPVMVSAVRKERLRACAWPDPPARLRRGPSNHDVSGEAERVGAVTLFHVRNTDGKHDIVVAVGAGDVPSFVCLLSTERN